MKSSKIAAVFQGSDGSLGYRRGTLYHLNLQQEVNLKGNKINTVFSISRVDTGKGICNYDSIHSFLDNWSVMHKYK